LPETGYGQKSPLPDRDRAARTTADKTGSSARTRKVHVAAWQSQTGGSEQERMGALSSPPVII